MLRTLDSEFDLARLMPCDEELVISFVPTNRDIYRILQSCHKLKTIYIRPDLFKEMPCVGQTLLYMQNVELVVDDDVPKNPTLVGDYIGHDEEESPIRARLSRIVIVTR
ncbi:MAG TPA: DUF1699 family protein [Methanothrix sp.]|nr:DUF1699 family protein [Methanothrix sp.]HPJ84317.1 DUF1699 family protein [Methanothrix sp.]HPR65842.1 DUF1699 family protein [Methanothrix sp.]